MVAADPRPVREEVPVALGTENPRQEVYDRLEGVSPTAVIADANPARDPMEGFETTASGTAPTRATREEAPAEPAPAAASVAATPAAPREAAPVVAAAPEPAPTPAAAPAAPGTHVVQVGAFGSDEEALRFFTTLSGTHGAFVGDKAPDIQRADVNGRTYHRLRLAPFASKAAAQDYCAQLKGRGQDCLVRAVS